MSTRSGASVAFVTLRAGRALREAHGVARPELVGALGVAHAGAALEDREPFLVAPFEVVRADALAGWHVVDAAAEPLPADVGAEAVQARAVAVGVRVVVVELRGEEVEAADHDSPFQ
jgi:hypothetical protein